MKEIQIEDDTFTLNSKRVVEFCKKIKKFNLRITLPNSIRADAPKNLERRLDMFKQRSSYGIYITTLTLATVIVSLLYPSKFIYWSGT